MENICNTCGGTGSTQHLTSLDYGDGKYEDRPCPGCFGSGFRMSETRRAMMRENSKRKAEQAAQAVLEWVKKQVKS